MSGYNVRNSPGVRSLSRPGNKDLKFILHLRRPGYPYVTTKLLRQTNENIIASIVDFISIFVAYRIGVQEMGILSGMAYGLFDAWLVVWQRERISNSIRWLALKIRNIHLRKEVSLPWTQNQEL